MTPGCSSNVRFTRSSNSRMRTIWVSIQTRRSLSRVSATPTPFPSGSELRARRLVRSVEDLLDRQVPQLLRKHLHAPGAVVAELAARGDVLADRELALARPAPVVDRP